MKPKQADMLLKLAREIQELARGLPPGKGHQIMNRCSKISLIIRKNSKIYGKQLHSGTDH